MHDGTLNTKRLGLGILTAILALTFAGTSKNNRGQIALAQDRKLVPVALFDRPVISDPDERALRQIRDKYFERFTFGMPSLDQVGGGGTTDCFPPGVREKLSIEKDTVLAGTVIDAHVYLNSTKQHVYTEYRVLVEQVLKSEGSATPRPAMEIIVNRWGGAIQFPSGEVREYWVRTLGMPEVSKRYLFFLEEHKEGQAFYIWTAFRLGAGPITPLDHLDSKLLPVALDRDLNEETFLSLIREAISASKPKKK